MHSLHKLQLWLQLRLGQGFLLHPQQLLVLVLGLKVAPLGPLPLLPQPQPPQGCEHITEPAVHARQTALPKSPCKQ